MRSFADSGGSQLIRVNYDDDDCLGSIDEGMLPAGNLLLKTPIKFKISTTFTLLS